MRTLSLFACAASLAFMTACSSAPASANTNSDTIVVSGQGSTMVVPDTMQFSLWVDAEGHKLSPLKTQVDQITATILRQLQEREVKREDMRSFQLSIQPKHKREGDNTVQDGFRVSRQIDVTLRQTDNFDQLIDFALAQGVSRVGRIQYHLGDASEASEQALLNAVEDAHHKAKLMAEHSDRELGAVLNIREQGTGGNQPMYRMAAQSMSMEVSEPGQQSISAAVEVTFRLR